MLRVQGVLIVFRYYSDLEKMACFPGLSDFKKLDISRSIYNQSISGTASFILMGD